MIPTRAGPSRATSSRPTGQLFTKRIVSSGGRFLTRGLGAVKAEAALSILAFNTLHAVNVFGAERLMPAR